MRGWIRKRARSLLRAFGKLVGPEIAASDPVRRSETIAALRGWSLRRPSPGGPPVLASLVVSYEWPGPVVRTGEPSPFPGSLSYSRNSEPRPEAGFFALKLDRSHSRAVLESYPSLACVGRVSLFGRVIEHERGYRAEGVRVDGLWVVAERPGRDGSIRSPDIVAELERRYRCDVRTVPVLRDAVERAVGRIAGEGPPAGSEVQPGG